MGALAEVSGGVAQAQHYILLPYEQRLISRVVLRRVQIVISTTGLPYSFFLAGLTGTCTNSMLQVSQMRLLNFTAYDAHITKLIRQRALTLPLIKLERTQCLNFSEHVRLEHMRRLDLNGYDGWNLAHAMVEP